MDNDELLDSEETYQLSDSDYGDDQSITVESVGPSDDSHRQSFPHSPLVPSSASSVRTR